MRKHAKDLGLRLVAVTPNLSPVSLGFTTSRYQSLGMSNCALVFKVSDPQLFLLSPWFVLLMVWDCGWSRSGTRPEALSGGLARIYILALNQLES